MSTAAALEWAMRPMSKGAWATRFDQPRDHLSEDRDKGYLSVVDNVGRRLLAMAFMVMLAVMANVAVVFAGWRQP
jgi:hypothetical protein